MFIVEESCHLFVCCLLSVVVSVAGVGDVFTIVVVAAAAGCPQGFPVP